MRKGEIRESAVQAAKEYDKEQIPTMKEVDVLNSFAACDNDTYIESVKKSTVRTRIILGHIDNI
ncbi:MAG: hypothetical protein WCS30_07275 [Selenomonadaceae bacterium]